MAKVAFFMFDGVRPDAITPARCPNIEGLRARGAATMQATSVMPCITLPCHTSIFHSVPPTRHGITTNVWTPMARPVPGLVDLLSQAGRRSAFVYSWEPLRDLCRPGSLKFAYFHDGAMDRDGDDITAAETVRLLAHVQPDFLFVYFGTVDNVGHDYGWMSPEYLAQLERADAALGTVLAALPEEYAVVLQADHGGHERTHGYEIPEDMTVPWLAAGPGIRQGHTIAGPVSLLDTAPTIAQLLGISPHPIWEGRCVAEIFE